MRLRYAISKATFGLCMPEDLQLAWPLGYDLKPSLRRSSSSVVQIPEVTRTQVGSKAFPTTGLTANSSIRPRSGLQRDRKSGRGLPKRFFMPWVIIKAVARDKASPIQPVFHSQSFLRQMSAFGVPRAAVGPGTKTRQTTRMIRAGAARATTARSHVGIVSLVSKG